MVYSGRAVVSGLIDAVPGSSVKSNWMTWERKTDFSCNLPAPPGRRTVLCPLFPAVAEALPDFTGIQSTCDGHPGFPGGHAAVAGADRVRPEHKPEQPPAGTKI